VVSRHLISIASEPTSQSISNVLGRLTLVFSILVEPDSGKAVLNLNLSPRGAAVLLRLAIHKLCKHLGESGENLYDDIASLVEKGLSPTIQKYLDVVRVIGNEAVHHGNIFSVIFFNS
jgi:hypothetical protein